MVFSSNGPKGRTWKGLLSPGGPFVMIDELVR
jgi:hypothetical protein